MSGEPARRLLLVGGAGGFVGRALLPELAGAFRVRSVHRHRVPVEEAEAVEWVARDVASCPDWARLLEGVDAVVNLAWYRAGPRTRFVALREGLERLLAASVRAGVRRFVQLSVPPAPPSLERGLPYLVEKRRFDAALAGSGLPYRILRPTMLFGPGDVLLSVMLRTIRRYGRFPMFGDGRYHVSPLAVADLARLLRRELDGAAVGVRDLGGPRRFEYRELTDLLFAAAGRSPRYWRLTERGGVRLARLLELTGRHLLYAYEVEWLVSDLLGLPPASEGLLPVESYLGRARGFSDGPARPSAPEFKPPADPSDADGSLGPRPPSR